jgi:3-oxoacyl-[acyl-carrier protein] reductase
MDLQLHNKVCIVTGGTRNLGRAIVVALIQEGAKVVATFRRNGSYVSEMLDSVPPSLMENIHVFKSDAGVAAECQNVCRVAVEKFGKLDVLINNAATNIVQPFEAISDSDFDFILHNTLRSVLYMSRATLGVMRTNEGRIVNISSAGVFTANPNEMLYACAKAGVETATRSFARLGARQGITVNAVAAHVISSGMGGETIKADPTIIDRIPLGRMGHIEEFVSLVLYLASPLCRYMTGQVLHLNGGRLMQ